ncbi:MAG: SDR family oxidoreductase [Gemmatimonadaceae bacterium]
MRIAIVGGTGLTGRHAESAVRRAGHEVVIVARSTGADLLTGVGVEEALAGADAVIDVTNAAAADAESARTVFGTMTRNLLAAEERAGVRHHVLLSIVSIERLPQVAHYAGKLAQEELVRRGPVPFTIVRATQFHEFGEMMVQWNQKGDSATIPPLRLQPVAASDAGEVLAEAAARAPLNGWFELAGPDHLDLVEMARRTLAARHRNIEVVSGWSSGFDESAAGDAFLPGPNARIAPMSFDAWLRALGA